MCRKIKHCTLTNSQGFGLIAAVFLIVIMSLFGLLLARYTTTSQLSSVEDYLWAQALYSAESTMRLNILGDDGGGGLTAPVNPTVGSIPTMAPTASDGSTPFAFTAPGSFTSIRVQAKHATGVSRTVEAKYVL